jgi:uncharacterized protein involved in exopolysaccharide biosynthesis/Mrp family chromosome partitioning ATPase
MNESEHSEQSSSLGPNDILFVLFKHKYKIVFFIVLAFIAGGALKFVKPPMFESKAKILIKYVKENRAPTMPGNSDVVMDPGRSIITTEMEILKSQDIAIAAAKKVGAGRILAIYGGGNDDIAAAGVLLSNLKVEGGGGSDVLTVSLGHRDPVIAQEALKELIDQYLQKHVQVHLQGNSYDFLQTQTDQVRARLAQTEDELRKEQSKAGIISLADAKTEIASELSSIRKAIFDTDAELVESRAQLEELVRQGKFQATNALSLESKQTPSTNSSETATALAAPDPATVASYQRLAQQLSTYKNRELEYVGIYKADSTPLRQLRSQIAQAEKSIADLGFNPAQVTQIAASSPSAALVQPYGLMNIGEQKSRIAGLEARARSQSNQLAEVTQKARRLEAVENTLSDLQRKKKLEEEQYSYFQTSLEKAKIDQALDSTKLNNINVVQEPSKAGIDSKKFKKILLMVVGGTAAIGFGFAFIIEIFLDPTVKRARELENKLKLPVLTSIPTFKNLKFKNGRSNGKELNKLDQHNLFNGEIPPWENSDPMIPYYEALRDRIVMSYNGDNHKPKVVGLTSCNKGAGVTRLATGLAAALSRDVQRNVLLIGLQSNKVSVSAFEKGRPAEALPASPEANGADGHSVEENLYSLATTGRNLAGASVVQSFSDLMPKLKVSDYDFIVFDLPPISQTSGSLRLASQMERTLLVVEAEKSDKRQVERAARLLGASRAKISTVFNKSRSYGPKALQDDI